MVDRRKAVEYKKEIYNLGRSFLFAFRGLRFAVSNERNMRIHLMVTLFVIEFSVIYGVTKTQMTLLCMMFGLVIAAEMINTAIEALVNLQTASYDALARIAKDVAAGAVLVLAVSALVVGGIIFLDFDKLRASLTFLLENPLLLIGFAAEFVLALLFIFFWNNRHSKRKKGRS